MFHDPSAIHLRGPAEIVAAVPYLLGFHPTDSFVVLAVHRDHLVSVLRLDLPEAGTDDDYPSLLHGLTDRVTRLGATACVLLGYGPATPVTAAVTVTTTALAAAGIPVRRALRVADGRLYSLDGTDLPGAAPHGTPFDPSTTVAAARATTAGYVALPDRAAVAAQLAPITGAARAAFTAATKSAMKRLEARLDSLDVSPGTGPTADRPGGDPTANVNADQRRAVAAWAFDVVLEAMTVYRSGDVLDDDRTALLTILLAVDSFWEFTLRRTTGEQWQIRMWSDLVRRAEPSLTAGPANLLTMVALQAGNGTLATCAVQRALDTDPDNELAGLLVQLIHAGIDPQTAAALISA
jgi:hypothetical protein